MFVFFKRARWRDYEWLFGSLLVTTTSTTTTAAAVVVVSGEGRAPESPVKKSVSISLRTRQHMSNYPLWATESSD